MESATAVAGLLKSVSLEIVTVFNLSSLSFFAIIPISYLVFTVSVDPEDGPNILERFYLSIYLFSRLIACLFRTFSENG